MPNALCIGINDYPGTGSDLAGCVNDAQDWAQMLTDREFSVSLMLDGEATRSEMIRAMTSIVTAAESGDTAVITYSGHGTWQPDDDGDEPDMRDEALCPHDLSTGGPLLDDDLFEIFAQRARGARVVFLSDSCHSGSVARIGPPLAEQERGRVRFLPPATFLGEDALAQGAKGSAPRIVAGDRTAHLRLRGHRVQLRRELRRPAQRRVHPGGARRPLEARR